MGRAARTLAVGCQPLLLTDRAEITQAAVSDEKDGDFDILNQLTT